jgi:hypothetical protein
MIRIFIYLIALLALLNVGVLLWPDSANYAPHVYSVKQEVNPHFVRLNKEIEERFYSQVGTDAGLTSHAVSGSGVGSEASALSVNDNADCYRVGPFIHQSNYELAQAVLFNAGVDFRKSKRLSKESSVYRVFLGPFENSAEAADARVELKRQKVLDHFVRKQGGVFIVSLGIYSTLTSADKAIELFEDKLGKVSKQAENVVLPESYWLHFSVADDDRARQQLRAIDWGETAAKMGLFGCDANL